MYPQIIQNISKETVERVFNKYFTPEKARIVIVGSYKKIKKETSTERRIVNVKLQDFGHVHNWSLKKLDRSLSSYK